MLAKRKRDVRSEKRAAKPRSRGAQPGAPAPPRGNRTSYRRLEDFQLEMRELADDYPNLVRLIECPGARSRAGGSSAWRSRRTSTGPTTAGRRS